MVCCGSGDGTPQSCTSAIPEMDFAFGSKNPTDVSQLAALAAGVSSKLASLVGASFFLSVAFFQNASIFPTRPLKKG